MAKVADVHFDEPNATKMEGLREDRRKRRRLIYDCGGARVDPDHRVRCRHGYILSDTRNGGVELLSVLRGVTPSCCQTCTQYEMA